jgi:glycosyltransferase involved in cell wall biosynthesis
MKGRKSGREAVAHLVFNDFRNDSRVEKTCGSLSAAGYSVRVFAFGGAGLPAKEKRDGWEVLRCGRGWRLGALAALSWRFLTSVNGYDLVHCHDLEPLPLAVIGKVMRGGHMRIVYDAHELETEKMAARGSRKIIFKVMERVLMPFVDELITVGERIADWYAKKYSRRKPRVIMNSPKLHKAEKSEVLRERLGIPQETRLFLYLGALSAGRSVEPMLDAFAGCEDRVLVLMGGGGTSREGRRLEALARERARREANVFLLGPVPGSKVVEYASSADGGLCLIEDECLSYRYCLPNKLFEYGMAGTSVVVSDLPELREVVERYGCGVICSELTAEGIRRAVDEWLAADVRTMGIGARRLAEERCWEKQEKTLVDIYRRLIPKARLDT